jgi:Asp-tRNA(Asn)/Glu-tRNA(Gln) amidotransferase B subunit
MADDSSPELNEIQQSRRRASDTTPSSSLPPLSTRKRRVASISITTSGSRMSTSHLDPEEKARRAAAAEGLDKGDKRRMQNKLAQRAFRARSKIVNKSVSIPSWCNSSMLIDQAAGRLEQLEQLTEQQASRIGNLTDLVARLQKENYSLKSAKFQEELMKGGMGMGMGSERQDMR